mmetsp:Transcript_1864/g.5568  ORF Transcript_1864/g.5568 Transcript_1864/m.5568 type:complete len:335 (+) Transcript_1864:120-1124(+)
MGQGPPAGGGQRGGTEPPWACNGCLQQSRPGDEYAAYMSQFVGSSPQQISRAALDHQQHVRYMEAQREWNRTSCCAMTLGHSEEDLVHPSLHTPIKTDFLSLGDPHGDGFECAELCRAICVTGSPSAADPRRGAGPHIREGAGFFDIDPRIPDGEVQPLAPAVELKVPSGFRQVQFDWAAPSAEQRPLPADQLALLQGLLKPFLRSMLVGAKVQLRLDPEEAHQAISAEAAAGGAAAPGAMSGRNIDAVASLTEDLATLLLYSSGVERAIPLSSVRWVRPPDDSAANSSWFLPNEREQMVVLRLAGGRLVRLRFQRKDQAAFFGTCMRLLLKAR